MNRLLIIDGNAVLHRAFHAMPEWRNKSGEATSGIYGFFSILLKAREDLSPDYLVVTFDMPEPNFRHAMYVGYQANRGRDEQLDKDIWEQVDRLEYLLNKLGVAVLRVAGYEADDIIGTVAFAAQSSKELDEIIILTGDRDLLQLVGGKVKVFMPIKGMSEAVLLDREGVKAKMEVWPEQIVDYKALVGDASDGYPGIAGIGPKTAVELLSSFGNFEEVVNHSMSNDQSMKDSTKKKIAEGYEMGVMSKKLALIVRSVPIKTDWSESLMPSREKFAELFDEIGHPSLRSRVMGESGKRQPKSEKQKSDKIQERLFE